MDDVALPVAVLGVAGGHGHPTLGGSFGPGDIVDDGGDDAHLRGVGRVDDLGGDHRVDEVVVVDLHDDLVALVEAVDPAEVVAVGAAVAGDGEVADAARLGGHVIVAGPSLVEDVGGGAFSERNLHPVPGGHVDESVDLTVADFAVEGGRVVGEHLAEGALRGLVLFFVRGDGLGDLSGDLVGRPVELPDREEADDDGEGDEQFADDTDDVPEDVGALLLSRCGWGDVFTHSVPPRLHS